MSGPEHESGSNSNPSRGNLREERGDDYVYFSRSTVGFSDQAVPKAKAFQLKLEHYYKVAVESAVQRNTRYVSSSVIASSGPAGSPASWRLVI